MTDGGHFETMASEKASGRDSLCTVVWITFKFDVVVRDLGISDALINFWEVFIKNKMAYGGYL